ncbi:MAG: DUF4364 family protein [Clostridia bacterium]|nr:DUF4364 family protein [Clostridia bacterium]
MASPIGDKRAVKIFLLYLLENINYPLELCRISDIVMQSDYVFFLDFAESFNELLDTGLVETVSPDGAAAEEYLITEKGRIVAGELKSEVLPSILDKALAAALRYLDFSRRGIVANCDVVSRDPVTGACDVRVEITEKKQPILTLTLRVDSADRARRMKENFDSRPEVIFRGVNALMSGNVNFLFDSPGGNREK